MGHPFRDASSLPNGNIIALYSREKCRLAFFDTHSILPRWKMDERWSRVVTSRAFVHASLLAPGQLTGICL
jgi:hypothetical protein